MKTSHSLRLSKSILPHYRQLILSFYLVWYLFIAIRYFNPSTEIWLNALVIACVVGIAINLSANQSKKSFWNSIRFFIIPFAVSSYTALIKGKDFFLIFPANLWETLLGISICLVFVLLYYLILRRKN